MVYLRRESSTILACDRLQAVLPIRQNNPRHCSGTRFAAISSLRREYSYLRAATLQKRTGLALHWWPSLMRVWRAATGRSRTRLECDSRGRTPADRTMIGSLLLES